MKCARVGCECGAVALPELQIPAVGYTFEAAAPLSMTLALALPMCAAHMTTARLSPDDLITPELRDTLDSFTSLRRKAARTMRERVCWRGASTRPSWQRSSRAH